MIGDFLLSALPWVAMGVAVIILAVNHSKKKNRRQPIGEDEDGTAEEKPDTYMTEGMAIGMCLGVSLGSMEPFDTGIGLSLGMLLGLAIGSGIKKPK